jgi:hypothetical protein
MTIKKWKRLLSIIGLSGKTPVREIPSEQLALFFSRQGGKATCKSQKQ